MSIIMGRRGTNGLRAAFLAATALVAVPSAASAQDGIEVLTGFASDPGSVSGMSRNGNFVFGFTDGGFGNLRGWIYSNGTYTLVPAFADPTLQTTISAINDAGTVWVGQGQLQGPYVIGHAIRYANGVFTDLHTGTAFGPGGTLENYAESQATAMSADTNVVAGVALNDLNGNLQAFRWTQATGMTGLGFLPGYTQSSATAISADGTTIIGTVSDLGFSMVQAMYWTQATGMVGLGSMPGWPGGNSRATAVSANGSVIVGNAVVDSAFNPHAFRWTQATGMQDLGTLPGGVFSSATAVSADGTIIAGGSNNVPDYTGPMFGFRWTQATGMQKLSDLLAARGISPGPGMVLGQVVAMSADGKITVGNLTGPDGSWQSYYIARCQSVICQGLTTYDQMASSYAGQSAVGQTANAAIGGTLGTMQEYATQAMQSQGSRSTPYSVFGYGAYDSDPIASGTLGLTADLPFGLVAGFTASTNYVKTDMVYNGNAKMFGGAVGAFIARAPETGLQWLLGGSLITLKGDIARGYLNGVTPVMSTGSTSGNGYGATARIGWGFAMLPQVTVTPFASYTFAETRFHGYSETSGVFASSFDDFISTSQVSRVGGDLRYTLAPNAWVWGTAAWGHRLDSGKGASITGTLIDAQFSYTAPGLSSAKDWAEVGGGVRLPVTANGGALTASLTASITPNQSTTYVSRVGVTQAF